MSTVEIAAYCGTENPRCYKRSEGKQHLGRQCFMFITPLLRDVHMIAVCFRSGGERKHRFCQEGTWF